MSKRQLIATLVFFFGMLIEVYIAHDLLHLKFAFRLLIYVLGGLVFGYIFVKIRDKK